MKITSENDQNFLIEEKKNQILEKNALKNFLFASIREIFKITLIPKSTVYKILLSIYDGFSFYKFFSFDFDN